MMVDANFQTDYFEPIFMRIVLLNFKIKKSLPFTDEDKQFYDILRHAFPAIDRLARNVNMTLADVITAVSGNVQATAPPLIDTSNVNSTNGGTSINATNGTTVGTTTGTTVGTTVGSTTSTATNTSYSYTVNGVTYTYGGGSTTKVESSSEDYGDGEIEATPETKAVLLKLDKRTLEIIRMTRQRSWIEVITDDINKSKDDDMDVSSDSAVDDNEQNEDECDDAESNVHTYHHHDSYVYERLGEDDEEEGDTDEAGEIIVTGSGNNDLTETIADMEEFMNSGFDNLLSKTTKGFDSVPITSSSV